MTTEEINKIKDKLSKLLALSTSPNENEAEAAMLKVAELCNKYNLRIADIHMQDGKMTADVGSVKITVPVKVTPTWEKIIVFHIAKTFDGDVIRTVDNNTTWTFIASPSDLEIITDMYMRVSSSIYRMTRTYSKGKGRTVGSSYALGLAHTVTNRLKMLVEARTKAEAVTTTDLVVVKTDAVQKHVHSMFPKLKTTSVKPSANLDKDHYMNGREDGNNISLNKAVGTQSNNHAIQQ